MSDVESLCKEIDIILRRNGLTFNPGRGENIFSAYEKILNALLQMEQKIRTLESELDH